MRVPKYRKHSKNDFAFIELDGKRRRLPGRFNSPESLQAYKDATSHMPKTTRPPDPPGRPQPGSVTLYGLALLYLDYAKEYYPNSNHRGEYSNRACVINSLTKKQPDVQVDSFGPRMMKSVRESWIDDNWSRKYINSAVGKIKAMFRWGVSEELVKADTLRALGSVEPLMPRRTRARETEPRQPVAWADVEATLPFVSKMIRDMILIQFYTGVRSDSLCAADRKQFEQVDGRWMWTPKHKQQYRNQKLIVPIGPRCAAVLLPYLTTMTDYLFRPREARRNRRYGKQYSASSYRQAVQRGQERAGIRDPKATPPKLGWVPHQLRHSRGQLVRDQFGLESAQAILGHAEMDATQIYTHRLLQLAIEAANALG